MNSPLHPSSLAPLHPSTPAPLLSMVVPRFVGQALRGEPLTVYPADAGLSSVAHSAALRDSLRSRHGQQTRCFCDVEDAVRAIIGLAECPEAVGQVFNIGSTEEVTILELAQKVLALVDDAQGSKGALRLRSGQAEEQRSKGELRGESPQRIGDSPLHPGTSVPRLRFVPYDQAYEAGFEDMRRRVPDISKICQYIGWEPRISLEETLRRIIEAHIS